ncbi:MAG: hypothetical protein HY246_21450 [Proteobacteria bacterium]|nr:hypothetical protein [Pseudomonadota bacterium]
MTQGVYYPFGLYVPTEWLVAVATSSLRLAAYRLQAFYPLIKFLHLAGTGLFFGLIVFLDLRLIGFFRGIDVASLMRPMLGCIRLAFAIVLLSGCVLFLFDPIQTGSHTMFLPKLLLIGVGIVNATTLHYGPWKLSGRRSSQAAAVASLCIWFLVVGAATWNATERPLKPQRALDGIERYHDQEG